MFIPSVILQEIYPETVPALRDELSHDFTAFRTSLPLHSIAYYILHDVPAPQNLQIISRKVAHSESFSREPLLWPRTTLRVSYNDVSHPRASDPTKLQYNLTRPWN